MAKMVYDESYGELTFAQRAAYRKYNVSPSDHDDLVDVFGESAHGARSTTKRRAFGPFRLVAGLLRSPGITKGEPR